MTQPGKIQRVAIVGAGPAGLRAAEMLVAHGLTPVLIDEAPRIGGRIYQQPPAVSGFTRSAAMLYGFEAEKAQAMHALFERLRPKIDYRPESLVFDIIDNELQVLGGGRVEAVGFDALILATGAMDRVIPFPGWTQPGVFTLGAAQIALKHQGCAIGRRVAFLGTGPLLYLVAYQYARAGAEVAAVIGTAPWHRLLMAVPDLLHRPGTALKGGYYLGWLLAQGIPVLAGWQPRRLVYGTRIEGIEIGKGGASLRRIDCDAVAMGYGLKSETQLAELAGASFAFDRVQHQWLPETDNYGRVTARPGLYLAGDGAAIGGADAAELRGRLAAAALLQDAGSGPRDFAIDQALGGQRRWRAFRRGIETAFPFPATLAAEVPTGTILCRCESVTAGDLRQAARKNGVREINRAKALCRVGMGRCQGRLCGTAAGEILAAEFGVSVDSVGRLRGQPPVKPLAVADLADPTG
jgi:NADPH-dependent 2,4-dienoyl-CoA reductase/sulfur reductase-like enzyme